MLPESSRTHLPQALALLYALCIVYASLYPFISWETPSSEMPYWLIAPARFHLSDFRVNCLAYVPLGLFIGLALHRRRFVGALLCGALLSFAMESCQWFMPPRDADRYDFLANALGAGLGGIAAWIAAALPPLRAALYRWRRWFLDGWLGDFGLALTVFWLAAQANPGIALFSIVFDPAVFAPQEAGAAGMFTDVHFSMLAQVMIGAAQISGVGLFAALLMRRRAHAVFAAMLLIVAAVSLKYVMALLILNQEALVHYIWHWPAMISLVSGLLLLYVFFALPHPLAVTVCAVILLSSLLAPLLMPDLLSARAPLSLFNDRYAHLLHFNGLTHIILLGWPLAASLWLFFLAGQPRWGARPELQ